MRAGRLINDARTRLNDTEAYYYSDSKLLSLLNEVVRLFAQDAANLWPQYHLASGLWDKNVQDLQKGVTDYDRPDNFFQPLEIYSDGTKLEPIGIDEMQNGDTGYIIKSEQISIYPAPDEFIGDGLEIFFIERPRRMAAVTEECPLSDEMPDQLIEGLIWRVKQQENPQQARQSFQLLQVIRRSNRFAQKGTNQSIEAFQRPDQNFI